jgi:hypothetical protein
MFQGHFWCFERRLQCITVVYMVLVVESGKLTVGSKLGGWFGDRLGFGIFQIKLKKCGSLLIGFVLGRLDLILILVGWI